MEARKLIFKIGERYSIRLQYYTSFFMVICICSQIFYFAILANLLSIDIMSTAAWISFSCTIIPLNIIILIILVPNAYINEEINNQITSLMRVREVYQRIIRDQDIIRENPVYLTNRIQQIAVRKLRNATKNLKGEERW